MPMLAMTHPEVVEEVLKSLGRAKEEQIRKHLKNEIPPMVPDLESLGEFVDTTQFFPKDQIDAADTFFKCFEHVLLRFRAMQKKNNRIVHTHEEFAALQKCVKLATLRQCGTLSQYYSEDDDVDWIFGYIVIEVAKKVVYGERLQDK